ncbi:glycosyltransferase family 39 protein [Dyadobacter arcticus]|uniref:Membrane protein n=1 Tax=Dyadobacter arcticus TaxID=1078754 RepID=A0ABX0UGN5_9BACT|nr:glycosyltransferase family 39 protein [Dyadobacter arcticus]NIJ52077.1 putative membrane protein [Dyadobacter arcticus]
MSSNLTQKSLQSWLILSVILVGALALRLYHLDRYSIFFDEKSTLVISQGIVLEGANQKNVFSTLKLSNSEFWKTPVLDYKPPVVSRSFTYTENYSPRAFTPAEFWSPKTLADYFEANNRSDIGNSPFYYLLLHYWTVLFGVADFSVRFFSVIFSLAIIVLTYLFGNRFFDNKTGLISAAIVAIEPFFVAYSQQARNYSLTFFLTLLATYFFLQIIENKADKRHTFWLYVGYILTAGLGLLSHFLVITVLMAHSIYAVMFLRSVKGWIRMAISAVLALSGVTLWMVFGGGQYTLSTLSYQADLYKRMAETRPFNNPFGTILPATFKNVFHESLPIFTDLVIFTHGLTDALDGNKYVLLAISVGILLIIWSRFKKRVSMPRWLTKYFPYIITVLSLAVYNNHRIQFGILSIGILALSYIPDIYLNASDTQRKRFWMLYMMGLFPTCFLVVMAFKGGHTHGLTQRYSGFSFPYIIILLSLLLQYFSTLKTEFKVLLYVFLSFQLYFVALKLNELYEDKSKYAYYIPARLPNPYAAAAKKIEALYQKGDTIFYPAPRYEIISEMDRTFLPYSIQDAQLTNLYLPKDAQYVQAMDVSQTERIWLKKPNNAKPIQIVNLNGLRYGSE